MKTLRKPIPLLVAVLALALAPPASAQEGEEELVPPDNSAVNQYTETFPTAGGDKDLNKGNKGGKATPHKVLGSRNTEKLERHGQAGREAAKLAAETAPATSAAPPAPATDKRQDSTVEDSTGGGGGGGGNNGGSGGDATKAKAEQPTERVEVVEVTSTAAPDVEGSSGLSEVLAQATGSTSSGQMGLLLPLLIVATLIWAAAFALRRTREEPR